MPHPHPMIYLLTNNTVDAPVKPGHDTDYVAVAASTSPRDLRADMRIDYAAIDGERGADHIIARA